MRSQPRTTRRSTRCGSSALTGAFELLLAEGDVIEAGALRIEVMATPGHTADSLSYRIDGNVWVGACLRVMRGCIRRRAA